MTRILLVLALTFASYALTAQKAVDYQEQAGVKKYFGIDAAQLAPKSWQAQWIWMRAQRGEGNANNTMMNARKTFYLDDSPTASRLFITGDTYYSLWVNGEFIGRGPARSAPHHQSYDILDISAKLKKGANVLAIQVHHSGNAVTFMDKVRPGLLFQLECSMPSKDTIIVSDAEVKVQNEMGWDTKTPQIDGSNMARVENFDARRSSDGWQQPSFDDKRWEHASLVHPQWWPPRREGSEDGARMLPWHDLVPRDLPYLEERFVPCTTVFETGECAEASIAGRGEAVEELPILGVMQRQVLPLKNCHIENLDNFTQRKGAMTVKNFAPASLYSNQPFRSTWIVFDMHELMLGYPRFEIEAPRGTNIDVVYAPFLIDGKFNPAIIPDNLGDRVILPGGKTTWECKQLRTCRYIGFLISNTDKPVKISKAGITRTWYPFQENTPMQTGDTIADQLAAASAKTLTIVTHDAFNDNYRERRQYIQTAWYAAKGNYSLFGDPYLMRRCLVQIAQDQFPNGFLPMHTPGKPKVGILEADFFWQMGLYDYYMFTGDVKTTGSLIDNLKRDLLAFEGLENADGILDNPPHPYWIDHTDLDRRGINFTLNGWYALALEKDAALLKYFNENALAEKCAAKSKKIKDYLKKNFWNAEKGLFAETIVKGKQTGLYDEISNGVALILKIADDKQAASIADKISKNDETHEMVRPVIMMYWPIEGLFSAGYGKEALAILKTRYKTMLTEGEGTLWEGWSLYTFNQNGRVFPKTRSATQAEQAFYPDVFSRYLWGLRIVTPGMKRVQLTYTGYGTTPQQGSIPTPYGNIQISCTQKAVEVKYPKAIRVDVDKKSFPSAIKISLQAF